MLCFIWYAICRLRDGSGAVMAQRRAPGVSSASLNLRYALNVWIGNGSDCRSGRQKIAYRRMHVTCCAFKSTCFGETELGAPQKVKSETRGGRRRGGPASTAGSELARAGLAQSICTYLQLCVSKFASYAQSRRSREYDTWTTFCTTRYHWLITL